MCLRAPAAKVAKVCFDFYAKDFLPYIPHDIELITIFQTFGADRIVEEMVLRFTHSLRMDWMLPGLLPTSRKAEFLLAGVIGFQNGKVSSEHLYWDTGNGAVAGRCTG